MDSRKSSADNVCSSSVLRRRTFRTSLPIALCRGGQKPPNSVPQIVLIENIYIQAFLLYPFSNCPSTANNKSTHCVHHQLGALAIRRFTRSTDASSCLGFDSDGTSAFAFPAAMPKYSWGCRLLPYSTTLPNGKPISGRRRRRQSVFSLLPVSLACVRCCSSYT